MADLQNNIKTTIISRKIEGMPKPQKYNCQLIFVGGLAFKYNHDSYYPI